MMGSQLLSLLEGRAEADAPLRVGLIGAGRFGTMFLEQARRIRGLQVMGVMVRTVGHAHEALHQAGWPAERFSAKSFEEALETGSTRVTDNADALIEAPGLDVVIEATGNPTAGIRYALKAIEHGRHIVMVNVEADVLVGPLLANRAAKAGVVYSLGYGDQPALICELVEWARCNGFDIVCAGKGARYMPHYRKSTPETVWEHYGVDPVAAERDGLNPRTYTAAIDGTKPAIEMAAVANATGLVAQPDGLLYPPGGVDDLPNICRPRSDGGELAHAGTVEVLASLDADGRPIVGDLRHGVYITLKAQTDYVRRCFQEYLITDSTGWYAGVYRPHHLVGLEVLTSVLKVGLREEPTGFPVRFAADVVATAKRAMPAGTVLDGEGGYTVYGKLMRAGDAVRIGAIPAGLACDVELKRGVEADQIICWSDTNIDQADPIVILRRVMEESIIAEDDG